METPSREDFLALSIEEQVSFINSRTIEGLLVSEVAKEIGIGDKTLRNTLKKNGYTFSRADKVYILDGITSPNEGIINEKITLINEIPKSKPVGIPKEEKKALFSDIEVKELKELLAMKEQLKDLLGLTGNNQGVSIIDIANIDRSNRKKATFNMDIDILNILKIYDDNQTISKSDIVNIAIREYLNKHGITNK